MAQRPSTRAQAVALLGAVPAVAVLSPSPAAALSTTWASVSPDPTAPLVAAVALAAWACTGWLVLVVLVTCGGRLPGWAGHAATVAASRLAPASVRALVRVAVGITVAGTVLTGPTALAAQPSPSPAPTATSLDWPITAPVASRPAAGTDHRAPTGRPAASATPAFAVPALVPQVAGQVVVQPGDSLWAIAAHAIGPQATPRHVARAWPQWWSANRAVLGDNPDLIHPGTALTRPRLNAAPLTHPTR